MSLLIKSLPWIYLPTTTRQILVAKAQNPEEIWVPGGYCLKWSFPQFELIHNIIGIQRKKLL